MISLSKEKTKRLLAIHGWSGTLLGLLLYVVIVTGAVAVLSGEIGRWSVGGQIEGDALGPGLNDRIASLSESVDDQFLDEISIYQNSGGRLVTFFHTHGTNPDGDIDDIGVMFEVHPRTGETLLRREGYGSELFGSDPAGALDNFIVDLHVNLHLPDPWGLYATGVLGFVMLIAAITGLLTHKHLLRDIFVPARYSSALLNRRDRHILAGSWGLPFAFILAFTGAFLSFAGSLTLPMVAKTAFGGDEIAMFEAMQGIREKSVETTTGRANLDTVVAHYKSSTKSDPTFLSIAHWGETDSQIHVFSMAAPDSLWRSPSVYSGVTGHFLYSKPNLGAEPSAANVAYMSMGVLHFGVFAGLLSKIVWVSLGFAMAYVNVTGMRLWIERRSGSILWRRFDLATTIIVYGLPIGLVGASWGFFAGLGGKASVFWTPVGFVAASAAVVSASAFFRGSQRLKDCLVLTLGIGLILTPILRLFTIGGGWGFGVGTAFDETVMMMDLVLATAGLFCLASSINSTLSFRALQTPEPVPAE